MSQFQPGRRFVGGAMERNRSSFFLRLALMALVTLVGTYPGLVRPAMSQGVIKERSLSIHADGEVAALWQVLGASMREAFSGTDSLVELRNISGVPQKSPAFYAEYFDRAGRLCFSLVFAPTDLALKAGSIEPDQVLRLGSGAGGLFLALQPEVLELHLLRQKSVDPGTNGGGVARCRSGTGYVKRRCKARS